MLAELVSGERDVADVLFLLAALAAIAASFVAWPEARPTSTLGWAGLAMIAVGLLVQ